MAKTIKPAKEDMCNGCEMCVFEAQRQVGKVGLEESLITVFKKSTASDKPNTDKVNYSLEIDPRISALNLEKISKICPRDVFEISEEE